MAALLSGGVAVGGLGLALLAGGAWMLAPAVCEGMVRRRTERRAAADVPAVLEATARGLRSGSSLATALADAAASTPGVVGAGLDRVVSAAARGQPLVEGLEQWGADCEVPGVRVAVSALVLAAEVGGPQAAALDGVATTLRQRAAARAEAVALGSQARMSAWVIAVAPVVFAVLASAADRRNAEFLLRTRVGLALLVAGLGLDAAGALWMARLTRMADP
jgi:tight adherence protein B